MENIRLKSPPMYDQKEIVFGILEINSSTSHSPLHLEDSTELIQKISTKHNLHDNRSIAELIWTSKSGANEDNSYPWSCPNCGSSFLDDQIATIINTQKQ